MHEITKAIRDSRKQTKANVLQDLVLSFFRKRLSINEAKRNQYLYSDYYTYKYPISEVVNINSSYEEAVKDKGSFENQIDSYIPKNRTYLTRIVESVVSHVLGSRFNAINTTFGKQSQFSIDSGRISTLSGNGFYPEVNVNTNNAGHHEFNKPTIPGINFNSASSAPKTLDSSNSYDYNFSINSIEFFSTDFQNSISNNSGQKAIYISKNIPVPGSLLGVKAKIQSDEVSSSATQNVELKKANSYELSFSFKENPTNEIDWVPIVPYGLTYIDSEIVFFNRSTKNAKLRFYPKSVSINLYENGVLVPKYLYTVNITNATISMPTYNEDKKYVAEYDIDNVNYSQDYIDVSVISDKINISPFSANGKDGEYFLSTNGSLNIELSQYPYVDHDNFVNPIYSPTRGTISSGSVSNYSPVSIKLSDGSYAINLTNYISGDFSRSNFYETSETLFYQNGKNIIFNKPISSYFYVLYNYINNNVRFRCIVRNNFFNDFNSGSLDCVTVKMKVNNIDNFASRVLGVK